MSNRERNIRTLASSLRMPLLHEQSSAGSRLWSHADLVVVPIVIAQLCQIQVKVERSLAHRIDKRVEVKLSVGEAVTSVAAVGVQFRWEP